MHAKVTAKWCKHIETGVHLVTWGAKQCVRGIKHDMQLRLCLRVPRCIPMDEQTRITGVLNSCTFSAKKLGKKGYDTDKHVKRPARGPATAPIDFLALRRLTCSSVRFVLFFFFLDRNLKHAAACLKQTRPCALGVRAKRPSDSKAQLL